MIKKPIFAAWLSIGALISSSPLAYAQKLASGYIHSISVKSDGTVWAWGDNTFGQLGKGSVTPSTSMPLIPGGTAATPSQVLGVSNVTKVASNYYQSMALTSSGSVWAWGWNGNGTLGDGTTTNRPTPFQISSLSNISAIGMGSFHSAAVTTGGGVYTWGYNYYGQLGDGLNASKLSPSLISITGVSAIALADHHTVALKSNGSVWTWGGNSYGELGNGNQTNSNTPVATALTSGVIAVAAGDQFSLALKSDGTVWYWGWKVGDQSAPPQLTPAQVSGLTGVTAIAAGRQHALARKSDGTVWAWGMNDYGQLGDGGITIRATPTQVPGLSGAVDIAAGQWQSSATDSAGNVWTWGTNDKNQLADISDRTRFRPEQVVGAGSVKAIESGWSQNLAVKQDGSVMTAGSNMYGQLGLGDLLGRTLFTPVAGLANVEEVSSDNYYALARKSDGTVWGWGDQYYGGLGDGTTIRRTTPVQASALSGITSISAGYYHSMALKSDGTVWTWGGNYSGQVGNGTTNQRLIPAKLTTLSGITAIAAGSEHCLALKSDGTVWAWGSNGNGAVGNGTFSNQLSPVQVNGLTDVIAIEAGSMFSMALKSDGSVWAWGSNGGKLGDGTLVQRNVPVRTGGVGMTGVVAISAGRSHALALKSNGTVWAWGLNGGGQLGDGTRTDRLSPVQISGADWATAISAGSTSTLALKADGTMLAWGFGLDGELSEDFSQLRPYASPVLGFNLSSAVPTVTVTSPAAGTQVLEGSAVNLSVSTTPGTGTISKVFYYSRGILLGEANTSPFSYSYTPTSWGRFEINAIAMNSAGVFSKPSSIWLTVTSNDVDHDGLPDAWENTHFGGIGAQGAQGDPDGDGLTNIIEYQNGANPNSSDGDADGLPDAWELGFIGNLAQNGSDDHDGDGVTNGAEFTQGTNPNSAADGNANGMPDDWELANAGKFAVWPPILSKTIDPGQTASGQYILRNNTGSAVSYSATVTANTVPNYSAADSLTGGTTYAWEEISTTGTMLSPISSSDDQSQAVNITGFTFPFYGIARSQVYVSSNGLLTFDGPDSSYGNIEMPGQYSPENAIAAFWDDLAPHTAGDIYYKLESDRLIVQYQNVARRSATGNCTFQVVLHSNGNIDLRYKTMTAAVNSATVGIQGAQEVGVAVVYNAPYIVNNLAVRITPTSEFFKLNTLTGSVPAWTAGNLSGVFRSFDLPPGNYEANVSISHNGTGTSPANVKARLTVANLPGTIEIVQPSTGTSVLEGTEIPLEAMATDPHGMVRVEFYDGSTKIDEVPVESALGDYYFHYWLPSATGVRTITAKAVDVYGGITTSAPVIITIIPDSDGDQIPDDWEVTHGFNPQNAADASQDADNDGYTNFEEYKFGKQPHVVEDTDSDTMPDGWEYHNGLKLDTDDRTGDLDRDGLTNLQEYSLGTKANNFDSDGDLLPDGWEVQWNLNPLSAVGDHGKTGDPDQDGLTNLQELIYRTKPWIADSDGDGTSDGTEVGQGSDPNDPGDGGDPPPANEMMTVKIIVGDPSGSHSERWAVEVKDLTTGSVILNHQSEEFGELSPDSSSIFHNFKRGRGYEMKLVHIGTDPQKLEADPDFYPDYDWALEVSIDDGEGNFIDVTDAEQKEFLVLDPWDVEQRQITDTVELLVNRSELEYPWEGHPDRTQQYQSQIVPKRVVLLPIIADYITRSPENGEYSNLGGITSESDARPTVKFTDVSSSFLSNGNLQITVEGTARDVLAEFLGTGGITSVEILVDGEVETTITNFQQGQAPVTPDGYWQKNDSTRTFSETFEVSNVSPGFKTLVARTNPNITGAVGCANGSILVDRIQRGDIMMQSPPTFQIILNQDTTTTAQDSISVKIGTQTIALAEASGQPASGVFTGNATVNGVLTPVQVSLPPAVTLTAAANVVRGKIGYRGANGAVYKIEGEFTETTTTSKIFQSAAPIAQVESPTNMQMVQTFITHDFKPRTFQGVALRFTVPDDYKDLFLDGEDLVTRLNGQQEELIELTGLTGDSPPSGSTYLYLKDGTGPRLFLMDDRIDGNAYPANIKTAKQFELSLDLKGEEKYNEDTAISDLWRLDEFSGEDLSGPAMAMMTAEELAAFREQTLLLFRLVFGESGMAILDLYQQAGLQIVFTDFWYIDPADYDFDGIRPYESDETPKLLLNTSELKNPMDAAVCLFTALQDLKSKSGVLLRNSMVSQNLLWEQTLEDFENGDADGEELIQAWRNAQLTPIKDTLTGFTECIKLGMSFTVVGEAIVTTSDVSEHVAEGEPAQASMHLGIALAPEVVARMAKACKALGKRWIHKMGERFILEMPEAIQLILKGIPKDATVLQKYNHLKPHVESGEISEEFLQALFNGGWLKSIDPYEELAENLGGRPLDWWKWRAHHDYPCAFELEFAKAGIDINAGPSSGRFLDKEFHKRIHGKGTTGWGKGGPWNFQWKRFFEETPEPTIEQIETFRDTLRNLTSDSSKTADQIDWPYGLDD